MVYFIELPSWLQGLDLRGSRLDLAFIQWRRIVAQSSSGHISLTALRRLMRGKTGDQFPWSSWSPRRLQHISPYWRDFFLQPLEKATPPAYHFVLAL